MRICRENKEISPPIEETGEELPEEKTNKLVNGKRKDNKQVHNILLGELATSENVPCLFFRKGVSQ